MNINKALGYSTFMSATALTFLRGVEQFDFPMTYHEWQGSLLQVLALAVAAVVFSTISANRSNAELKRYRDKLVHAEVELREEHRRRRLAESTIQEYDR